MPSRDLTASVQTELAAAANRPFWLVEVELAGGTLRYWSGQGTLSWGTGSPADDWTGAGILLDLTPAGESAVPEANGATVVLTGVNSAVVAAFLANARQNKPLTIYLGFLDSSGAVIADPYAVFVGVLDTVRFRVGPDTAAVVIAGESRMLRLRRSNIRRYTPQDQQAEYSGDKGFDYVPAVRNWTGEWAEGKRNLPGRQTAKRYRGPIRTMVPLR